MSSTVHYHLGAFPPKDIEWPKLMPLIGKAHAALARYDGLVAAVPNAQVLLAPLTNQEAVLSSKIEGTNVTLSEVLEIEAGGGEDAIKLKRDDVEEVLNYRNALSFAANSLDDQRPLSQHLLREAHKLLMRGVRGRNKNPGAFRDRQNWIGHQNRAIEEAAFVPIPQEHLQAGLDRWSAYVQSREEFDPLVQLAIIHVEFEAIHPFEDGNGRLGRMIIPLFLYERDLLSGPNFYISRYLEARRDQYVEMMRKVSSDGSWTDWCAFFLRALIEQAFDNQSKAQKILELHQNLRLAMRKFTRSPYASNAVEFIFSMPIFTSTHFRNKVGISRPTTLRILKRLQNAGIIKTIYKGAGRRHTIFAFPELLKIVEA